MSIAIMSRLWTESPHKGSELLLLLAIADNANDDGVAWPSQETLAAKTRLSVRQVRRLTDVLVGTGAVAVEDRRHGSTTRRVYRFPSCGQDVLPNDRSPGHPGSVDPDIAMSAEPSEPSRPSVEPNGSTALALVCDAPGIPGDPPSMPPVTAQTLVAEFVDGAVELELPIGKRLRGQVARNVGELLAEGHSVEEVRAGIARMLERRVVQPTLLANFMLEAALPARPPPRRYGYGVRNDELKALEERLRQEGR
jgi:hypothetical protein